MATAPETTRLHTVVPCCCHVRADVPTLPLNAPRGDLPRIGVNVQFFPSQEGRRVRDRGIDNAGPLGPTGVCACCIRHP